jgi:parvulin-like peptidyl-prolyl isomerase
MAEITFNPGQKKITAATVNRVVISQFQVELGLASMLEPYRDEKGKLRLSQEKQYEARQYVIDNLIMRELLYQEGCRKAIKVSDGELEKVMQRALEECGSERQFKAMLLMTGLTPEEYRAQMIKDLTVNKVAASVVEGKKRPVTKEEAKQYYETHKEEMTGPEARRLLHLMVELDRYVPQAEEKKARIRLETISKSPAKFGKMLQQDTDSSAQEKAEDMGYVLRGQLHPILESVAFTTPAGKVTRVIRTEEGLHIFKVKEVIADGEIRPFALVEEELEKKLYEMRSVEMLKQFTDKLRKKAKVKILDRIVESRLNLEKE